MIMNWWHDHGRKFRFLWYIVWVLELIVISIFFLTGDYAKAVLLAALYSVLFFGNAYVVVTVNNWLDGKTYT